MKIAIACMGLMIILAVRPAVAQQTRSADGDVVVQAVDGVLKIQNGERVLLEKSLGESNEAARVETATDAKGNILFSVATAEQTVRRIVGVVKGTSARIVWEDTPQISGDPGEETSVEVRLMDLDRDGSAEIVRGTTYAAAHLCGQSEAPLLFREVFDVKRGTFIPTGGKRALSPRESLLPAVDFTPGILPGPRVSFLIPDGVSSSEGDDRNPLLLTAPYALVDNQPETGWRTGSEDGYGEFATFLTESNEWNLTAIAIDTADAARGVQRNNRFASPASVVVTFDKVAYRLILPESPGRHWFELPEPVRSSCMSVILEKSAGRRGVPMSVFEVSVQTELDQPDGLQKLASMLNDEDRGEAALHMLMRVGSAAFEAVNGEWKHLTATGMRRAVRFLSESAPVAGAGLLVSYGVTDGRYVGDAVVSGLKKSAGKGEVILGKYLNNASLKKANAARQLLVKLETDRAFDVLLASLPTVPHERRRGILSGIAELAKQNDSRLLKLIARAVHHWENRNVETMFELLKICVISDRTAGDAAALARKVFDESEFADQYRALRIIATSRATSMVPFLIEVANGKNEYLRRLAIRALGQFDNDVSARKAVIALSSDASPGVQMEAMNALLNFATDHKKAALVRGIESPWPQVRALAVKNAGVVSSVRGKLVMLGLSDSRYMVVTEALDVAAQLDDRSVDTPLRALLTESKNAKLLVQTARAVGARCQNDDATVNALFALLRMGAEPLATSAEKAVGVSAADALGKIGSPAAVRLLKKVRERSNLTTDKAIDAALVQAKSGCVSR